MSTERAPDGGPKRTVAQTLRRVRVRLVTAWGVLTEPRSFIVFTEPSLRLTLLGEPEPEDFRAAAGMIDMAADLEATGRAVQDILQRSA